MKALTEFFSLFSFFWIFSVPLYWVLVGLECFVLTHWRKGLSQTGTFAFLVWAQVLSPFSYFLFLSIVPGSDDVQNRFWKISDRETNAGAATAALCIFLFISSVVILSLRGKNFRQRL